MGGQPPKLPLPLGDRGPHLIHGSLGPPKLAPKCFLDQFAGLTNMTNRQTDTDRQSDYATMSVATGSYRPNTAYKVNNGINTNAAADCIPRDWPVSH